MNKVYIIFLFLNIFFFKTNAQITCLDYNWVKGISCNADDKGTLIRKDTLGNVYSVGLFYGNATFGNKTLSVSGSGVYIAKLDSNGNCLWAKSISSPSSISVNDVAVDYTGSIHIIGDYELSLSFDQIINNNFTTTSLANSDVFYAKINAQGIWNYEYHLGGNGYDYSKDIECDNLGNAYFTFYNLSGASYMYKINNSGGAAWTSNLPQNIIYQLVNNNNSLVFLGVYSGTKTFGSTTLTSASGQSSFFIAKMNYSGQWIFARDIGIASILTLGGVTVDPKGNIFILGSFTGAVSIGSTPLSTINNEDIFLAKLSSTGNWNWVKKLYSGRGKALISDNTGNIVLSYDSVGYNSNNTKYTLPYLLKTDSNGIEEWNFKMGGILTGDIFSGKNGSILATGTYKYTSNFGDKTMLGINGGTYSYDAFFCKLNEEELSVDIQNNYTINCGDTLSLLGSWSGIKHIVWIPTIGVDSIDKISSTIKPLETTEYKIIASNYCGDTVFRKINVTVTNLYTPSININSNNTSEICKGDLATFNAVATYQGTSPIYYWKVNGLIRGINNPIFQSLIIKDGDTISCTLVSNENCITNDTAYSNIIVIKVKEVTDVVSISGNTLTSNQSGAQYQWLDCNNSFAPVSGGTNQSFFSPLKGSFAVLIKSNGCKVQSECYDINYLGIDYSDLTSFYLYPNPAYTLVYLSLNKNTTVEILNLTGKLIISKAIDKGEPIDISFLNNGMYFLKTKEGFTRKFIKE